MKDVGGDFLLSDFETNNESVESREISTSLGSLSELFLVHHNIS